MKRKPGGWVIDDSQPSNIVDTSQKKQSDLIYQNEWARRATEWAMRMRQGGETRETQIRLNSAGDRLRTARFELRLPLEFLAKRLDLDPALLCFLESGWATQAEFLSVIDEWAKALAQDPVKYRQQVAPTYPESINQKEG